MPDLRAGPAVQWVHAVPGVVPPAVWEVEVVEPTDPIVLVVVDPATVDVVEPGGPVVVVELGGLVVVVELRGLVVVVELGGLVVEVVDAGGVVVVVVVVAGTIPGTGVDGCWVSAAGVLSGG